MPVPGRRRDLLPTLRFPSLIAACYEPSEDLCSRLLAATTEFTDTTLGAEGTDRLAAHRGRYTMQQERDAHGAVVAAPFPTHGKIEPGGTDSIEMFDEPSPDGGENRPHQLASPGEISTGEKSPVIASAATPASSLDLSDGIELF